MDWWANKKPGEKAIWMFLASIPLTVFWEPAGICLFGWALVWYLSDEALWIGLIIALPILAGCFLGWLLKEAVGDMSDKVELMDAGIKAERIRVREAIKDDIGKWRGLVVGNLRVPSDGTR